MMDDGLSLGSVERGCGKRVRGGVYVESRPSKNGKPLEYFLVDPVIPCDAVEMGVSPRGTSLVEIDGVFHVFDWIGSKHYPNVADFVEETRRFGLSRRVSKTIDFGKLTRGSMHVALHSNAYFHSAAAFYQALLDDGTNGLLRCPKLRAGHDELIAAHPEFTAPLSNRPAAIGNQRDAPVCAALWWEDIDRLSDGVRVDHDALDGTTTQRDVIRQMPGFSYKARATPERMTGRGARNRSLGFVLALPITNIAVVDDPDDRAETERVRQLIRDATTIASTLEVE